MNQATTGQTYTSRPPPPPVFNPLYCKQFKTGGREGHPILIHELCNFNFLVRGEHLVYKLYLVRLPCLVFGVGSIHHLWLCSGEEDQWVSLRTGPEEGEEQEITALGQQHTHYKLPPNPCVEIFLP